MKRNLIVLTLAALAAGTALAQSSVTVYGRLNLSAEQQDFRGTKTKVLANDDSRLGLRGSEDLGGGLRGGFVLEHGFSPDTGLPAAAFFGRQSEVNLSGGFGTLRLGNFAGEAYFATADSISMHNHDSGSSADMLYARIGRGTNKIAYRTLEFVKGLTLEAAVSAPEGVRDGTVLRTRSWDFAANWNVGALHLGLGYEKNGSANQAAVSGLYDFGPVIVGALVQRDTNAYGSGTRTNARVSAAYLVGVGEFHVNVGLASDYSNRSNSGARQVTVAYNHNLSRRTKLYVLYTKVDAEAFTSYTADSSALAAGMRHNF